MWTTAMRNVCLRCVYNRMPTNVETGKFTCERQRFGGGYRTEAHNVATVGIATCSVCVKCLWEIERAQKYSDYFMRVYSSFIDGIYVD